jgi:hypothetical protein
MPFFGTDGYPTPHPSSVSSGTVTVATVTVDGLGFGPPIPSVTDDGWGVWSTHKPIPSATDDGWGVYLNPSVSVIRRRIGLLWTFPQRAKDFFFPPFLRFGGYFYFSRVSVAREYRLVDKRSTTTPSLGT